MRRELGMSVALILMCLALWISNPDFLGHSNSINALRQISMLGIFAIGIGFVIISGGIDLSIGSMVGLTGVIIAKFSSTQAGGLGYSLWVGIPVAVGVALLLGLAQGLLITRLKLQPFIVTLGGMLLFRGVSQTIAEGGTLSLTVTKTGATAVSHNVSYATANGTAAAGSDYTSTSNSLTFLASETTKNVSVVTLQDTVYENNETVFVNLSNPTNGATVLFDTPWIPNQCFWKHRVA